MASRFTVDIVLFVLFSLLSVGICANYSCGENNPSDVNGVVKNNWHWRGTNLGGWLVLEPWITPSLFYQFLGANDKWNVSTPEHVAFDSYTFCTVLGPVEANRQLRRHWETWVTKEHIAELAATGIDTLRIPVADWMFVAYKPFIGCWDGSLEALDTVLEWCKEYGLNALIDVHAVQFSQNPFDNSGHADKIVWLNDNKFKHEMSADWFGVYNDSTYITFNQAHMDHVLGVVKEIIHRYKSNEVVVGVEPVNEPWYPIPIESLKEFYWQVYQLVQRSAPHWITLLHDSFRLNLWSWDGFLSGCDNWGIDTHIYQAWSSSVEKEWVYQNAACNSYLDIGRMEREGIPVVVGEWSLATDNCAMWLNGLNDNMPGYPIRPCRRIPCPTSYTHVEYETLPVMEDPIPVSDNISFVAYLNSSQSPDEEAPIGEVNDQKYDGLPIGPFGSGGDSFVINNTCTTDILFSEDPVIEDQVQTAFVNAKLFAYDTRGHGNFFWNFRTELEERWDFLRAYKRGWIGQYRLPEETSHGTQYVENTKYWTEVIEPACLLSNRLPEFQHTSEFYDPYVPIDESITGGETTSSPVAMSTRAAWFCMMLILGVVLSAVLRYRRVSGNKMFDLPMNIKTGYCANKESTYSHEYQMIPESNE